MAKRGKKYEQVVGQVDKAKAYEPAAALELLKKTHYVKFDETVELHLRMGIDPRAGDQQVRGIAQMPHGLGKTTRVLVFAQGDAARIASEAGADYVGADDLIKKVEDGWVDFEMAIATPDMMPKIGRLGKVIGRRGLMPNPKSGTVVAADNLLRVIQEARQGRVEFRPDRTGIIHVVVGKLSFPTEHLAENLASVIDAIVRARPSGAKGQYIQRATLSSTMGLGIRLDLRALLS